MNLFDPYVIQYIEPFWTGPHLLGIIVGVISALVVIYFVGHKR